MIYVHTSGRSHTVWQDSIRAKKVTPLVTMFSWMLILWAIDFCKNLNVLTTFFEEIKILSFSYSKKHHFLSRKWTKDNIFLKKIVNISPFFFHPHVFQIIDYNYKKFDIHGLATRRMTSFSSWIWADLAVGSCLVMSALQKTWLEHLNFYRNQLPMV